MCTCTEKTQHVQRERNTHKKRNTQYTHVHTERNANTEERLRERKTQTIHREYETHTHMFVYITVCLKTLNFYSPLNWIFLFCAIHKYSLWGYRLAIEAALDNKETVNRTQKSKFGITNLYVIHRKGKADDFQVLNFPDAPLEM